MPRRTSLLVLLLTASPLFAQEFRASVAGQVADASGATMAGADVTITSVERNTSSRTVSNAAGRYVLEFLLPGHYTLTAEKAGFKKLVRSGINLASADHLALDISLQVGDLTQSVTVTTETPVLETETASRAET